MKRNRKHATLFRFLAVGGLNTFVGSVIMFCLFNLLHVDYWLASSANYVIGSILSFVLNKRFTFRNHNKSIKIIIKFVINILICYMIAYGVARPIAGALLGNVSVNIKSNTAMLIGMCCFVILNYFGQKYFAFGYKPVVKHPEPGVD